MFKLDFVTKMTPAHLQTCFQLGSGLLFTSC